jgi:hypothetical protein
MWHFKKQFGKRWSKFAIGMSPSGGSIIKLFAFSLTLFFSTSVFSKQISIKMTVDKNTVSDDNPVQLQVTVSGTQNPSSPIIKNISNFEIENSGSSTQIQIINGKKDMSKVFHYILYPQKAGVYQIGPAVTYVNNKAYKSNLIKMKILKQGGAKKNYKSNFFIKASVNNPKPFINEQVEYTFSFYTRTAVGDAQLSLPDFTNFWKEETTQKQNKFEVVKNGLKYQVTEIKLFLFPQKAGKLIIKPASLAVEFIIGSKFGFSKKKKKKLKTEPVSLHVLPLPYKGKPSSFHPLVGKFNIKSLLPKKELALGESATLTVKVEGNGNLRDVKIPELEWTNLKIYSDQPQIDLDPIGDSYLGTKTFKLALVPEKEGKIDLPQIIINYFDPAVKKYKKLKTEKYSLMVTPGDGDEKLSHLSLDMFQNKKQVKVLGQDIMPIKLSLNSLNDEVLDREAKIYFMAISLFMFIGYAGVYFFHKRRMRLYGDAILLRSEKAYKNFQKKIKSLNQAENTYELASRILREYIGDKLGFDGKALTAQDIDRKLNSVKLKSGTIKSIKDYLTDCEMGQYGGKFIDGNTQTLVDKVKNLGKSLEKEIRL